MSKLKRGDILVADRKARKKHVDAALAKGFPPPGVPGKRGALREAASTLKVPRTTLQSWIDFETGKSAAGEKHHLPDWTKYVTGESLEPVSKAPVLSGSPESRRITELEDETRRLKSEIRGAHREALDEDAVRELIGSLVGASIKPPKWVVRPTKNTKGSQEVPMVIWSDWHLGEVVSLKETGGINEYNPVIAEERIRTLVESIVNLCRNHGPKSSGSDYPGIVVNLLGDFISGGLHPELLRTDAEGVMQCVVRARDLLVWGLEKMADEFGRVFCPCAAGNHGRNTDKPEYKGYLHHNFDWLIYQMLIRHFENDDRVQFMVPSANECFYRVYGLQFLAMHGDMLGARGGDGIIGSIGPIMRGEFKTRGQYSASNRIYDYLLMGHYHQELWLPRAIVANSIKGFDEYVKNSLRAMPSEPSQPMWFVHPKRGITSRWNVKVNPSTSSDGGKWLTWEKAA